MGICAKRKTSGFAFIASWREKICTFIYGLRMRLLNKGALVSLGKTP